MTPTIREPRMSRVQIVSRDLAGRLIVPTTKKNSQRLLTASRKIAPSHRYQQWAEGALAEATRKDILCPTPHGYRWLLWDIIGYPVNCSAIVYRRKLIGDAVGYYQAVADWLELAGALVDDKWIVSWDGSRMRKDPACPRVEVTLTEVMDDDA